MRSDDDLLFLKMPKSDHTAKMVKEDLEATGVPYKDADGNHADFHALRHTFVSRMLKAGANAKVVQRLARHRTPTLTLGRYAHAQDADLRHAVASVPRLTSPIEGAEVGPSMDSPTAQSLPQDLLLTGDPTRTSPNSGEQGQELRESPRNPAGTSDPTKNRAVERSTGITISCAENVARVAFKTAAINHSATPPQGSGAIFAF